MILETGRLHLRRLTLDDAPFMLRLLNDASFLRFIGDRGVRSLEDARGYLLAGTIASYQTHGFGMYLAELRQSGVAIGLSGLVKRDWLADVDIGFALLPPYWSQGLASEAALAVMQHAQRDCGLKRLAGIVSPDNLASIRVLEKLGMHFERKVRASPSSPEVSLFARALG